MTTMHPRVVFKRRATITDLPLYYSGQLLKKNSKEEDFKEYYGELRGATLFLYKDGMQDTYTERLDLEQLKSMVLDSPYQRKTPTIFTLTLQTEEVQLKMENPDRGEEWRGYILTVIKKVIPSKLQLLPGQMLQLQEVLDQEKGRNPPAPRPPLPPRPDFLLSASQSSPSSPPPRPPKEKPDHSASQMPACFFNVTRPEAERMLAENPEYGSIILRPSTLANNYAVSIRQQTASGHVMKNYRVTSTDPGFVIELDIAVTVSSLDNVLQYFIKKTKYNLQPYMASQPYDTRIDVSPDPKCISITSTKPKTVPKALVAPMLHSRSKKEFLPPPSKPEEGDYVCPDDESPEDQILKQVNLELRDVLKSRKEAAASEEEVHAYGNQESIKTSHPGKAQWNTKSPPM